MFARSRHGGRRLSPPLYKLLVAAHTIVSVGWLGVVLAKVVLAVIALTTARPEVAAALRLAMEVINVVFPPLAVGTIVTGALLSFGTKWGLLQHAWVVAKLALTVGVIATAVALAERLAQAGGAQGLAWSPTALLLALSAAHLLMLGAATALSVYKPWGKLWLARRTR